MKKLGFQVALLTGVVILAISLYPGKIQAASIELTYNDIWPMTFPGAKAQKEWCEKVEKRSDGRVKIKFYSGGKLYRYKPSERAVASGSLDITQFGVFQIGFICQAVMLPMLFNDWEQVKKFHEQGGHEIIKRSLVSSKVINLFAIPSASITAISRSKIQTMEDLKGLKMRSPTPQLIDFLGKLGASNVHVATGEVYQALQLGTIDGVITTTNSFLLRKWYEPAKYFLNTPLGLIPHYSIMNLDKWNSLPKDIQKIMLDTGKEIEDQLYVTVKSDDENVRKQLSELRETVTLSPKESDRWSEKARLVWKDWANQGPDFVEALNLARKITGQ